MRAMDIPYTAAHGTIRFSFSRYNSMHEVDEVLKVMPGIVATLRKLSPYWDSKTNEPVANPEQAFAPTYS
jgi:cysteine desulfurase